jgi:hypothetical protein
LQLQTIELQFLGQVMQWLNTTLVNTLLSTPQLCRAGTAYSIKVSVSHLEQWLANNITSAGISGVASQQISWLNERLEGLREAANVLLIDKRVFTDDVSGVFSTVNLAQISRLLSQFQPDDFAPEPVPQEALQLVQKTLGSISDPAKKRLTAEADAFAELPLVG